jgi:glycolate oxidase FAD binding subunit
MKTATAALTRLEEITGRENVIGDPAQLAAYAVDEIVPAAAVLPASVQEIGEVVRFAAGEKLSLIATGARTKLGIGAPPSRYDIALDLTRMNRVLAYDPGDLTLGVEPGIGVAALLGTLAEHRQFLPLLVPYFRQATIGGTLASGVDSPLRQAYGTARDFVLGMEFVTGEGVASKSGGRVVKNVTGYDLHKLLLGSLGTLAIITRVNFRTFPIPPISCGFLANFAGLQEALKLRHSIAKSPLAPITLEILSPEMTGLFARHTPQSDPTLAAPGPFFAPAQWTLAAGIGGNEQVVARHVTDLTRLAKEAGALDVHVLDDQTRPAVWGRLRECFPLMLQASPAAAIVKISALPGQTKEILGAARRIAEHCEVPHAGVARGIGTVYVALLPAVADAATLERLARAASELMKACEELGAPATLPWAPLALKQKVDVWGAPRGDLALMQRLKKVFDPQGILAPGRFAGGI